jgi:hypothetical protein
MVWIDRYIAGSIAVAACRDTRASARPCVCFRSERKRRATGYYIGARQRVFWCGRVDTVFVFDAGTGMESREGTHGTD